MTDCSDSQLISFKDKVIHICKICGKSEKCKGEKCSFFAGLECHSICLSNANKIIKEYGVKFFE